MGWVRWTGKTLEFVGKLARAESFERWAESQGEKIISDLALKSGRIIFGLGKESKAKGILHWSDLQAIAEKSPSLNAAIQEVIGQYPSILSSLRSNYSTLPHESVYLTVIPRLLVNRRALAEVTKSPHRPIPLEDLLMKLSAASVALSLSAPGAVGAEGSSAKRPADTDPTSSKNAVPYYPVHVELCYDQAHSYYLNHTPPVPLGMRVMEVTYVNGVLEADTPLHPEDVLRLN
jgi:hypothetical protein